MQTNSLYPFTAVVGQEQAKKALLIALVNPKAGGLLIGGRKGTAKSVLARSTKELIGSKQFIDLPLNVTEDMLFGSIDIEYAVSKGQKRFAPGILARANENILYIDEVNLLRQELLLAVLDANAAGINQVERDGISFTHPVHLTVLATMNPEEGVLPQHILDRFGMYVDVEGEAEIEHRVMIMRRALAYGSDCTMPQVPGNRPYKKGGKVPHPKGRRGCNRCGVCARQCPTDAIPLSDPKKVDASKCISCMKCVSVCPTGSRSIGVVMNFLATQGLKKPCATRKENELYL